MPNPMKLYNHALAPNPLGFASSRRKRASNLGWQMLIEMAAVPAE
jgi:hypothetical protein